MMINLLKDKLDDSVEFSEPGVVYYLNPFSYLQIRKKQDLLEQADRVYIDGQWLCNFLRWFGVAKVTRRSFDNSSMAPYVFNYAQEHNLSVALVGSDAHSFDKFLRYIQSQYPNLNIIAARHGYFDSEQECQEFQTQLVHLKADIVVVGMGAVRQENFLSTLKKQGWRGQGFTCGGFMHQSASKGHHYYPDWVNKFHLRFAYRMWQEPKLIRRYTLDYGKFVLIFAVDVLHSLKKDHKRSKHSEAAKK